MKVKELGNEQLPEYRVIRDADRCFFRAGPAGNYTGDTEEAEAWPADVAEHVAHAFNLWDAGVWHVTPIPPRPEPDRPDAKTFDFFAVVEENGKITGTTEYFRLSDGRILTIECAPADPLRDAAAEMLAAMEAWGAYMESYARELSPNAARPARLTRELLAKLKPQA